MRRIENLLDQIRIINKKNAEILDASGGRFNMFRMCGVDHYENTHSAIIAEFLNPNGTHGLKSKFLECFLETLKEYFKIESFNYDNSRVKTEHSTEEGRIDILIEDNQNKAIIIENKIYAIDQQEQLKRYERYAQTYKNGYQILYLTLFGEKASEQSGAGVSYLQISYKENIINWLEKCVAISSRFPMVRETIIQYINHLKHLTNQDMDTKNQEEITEVLSKIENLKAAKIITQAYSGTFNFLANKYFNPKMEEFAKQKGLEYHYQESNEFSLKFYFTHTNWQEKYMIVFNIEQGYIYGLFNDTNFYSISDENRKLVQNNLKNLIVGSWKESTWYPFYAYIPNLSIDAWENDIINSDNYFNDCKEKIENLLTAMEGLAL